jgi:hypothetical protein
VLKPHETYLKMPERASKTEIAAELTLLSTLQSEVRKKRIFIGWRTTGTTAYEGRGGRITFLRNQLLKQFLFPA